MSINVEPAANQDAIERAQAAMGGLIFSSDLGPNVSNEQPKIAWGEVGATVGREGEVGREEEGRGNFTKTKESRESRQSSSDLPPTNCNQFHVFFVQVVIALAFLAFCISMLVLQTQKQGVYLPLLSACIGIWFPSPSQKQVAIDNRHVVGLLAQILIAATVMGFCMFMLLRGESEAMYLSLMSACMTYWMTSPQQSKDFGRATVIGSESVTSPQ
jgi:hypothetical protein